MGHLLTQFNGQLRTKTGKKGSKNGPKNGQKRVRNTIPMTQKWVIGMVFRVHVLARVCLVASEKRDLKMYKIWNMTSIPMTSRPTTMTHFWTKIGPKMGHLLTQFKGQKSVKTGKRGLKNGLKSGQKSGQKRRSRGPILGPRDRAPCHLRSHY